MRKKFRLHTISPTDRDLSLLFHIFFLSLTLATKNDDVNDDDGIINEFFSLLSFNESFSASQFEEVRKNFN
jgi:hypothetical protein